jgi:hypothetical protein
LVAVPFDLLGPNIGGRAWILFGLLCLAAGFYLALRGRPPTGLFPAFASVPTALVMLNAQTDGLVVLGMGAAMALWPRRFLVGLVLGLTLMKPQLVLPLAIALVLLVRREWKVLLGWAASGAVLLAATLAVSPHWVLDWLGQTRSTVQTGAREIDLPHFAVLLPDPWQGPAIAVLTVLSLAAVLWLAWRVRGQNMRPPTAILVAGGVLAAPHALAADYVVVALAIAIWGEARWFEWLGLSAAALASALLPAPIPTLVGVVAIGWICLRVGGLVSTSPSPAPAPASAR